MDKIRLLHLTYDLSVSGLERVVVTICRTLDRDRFEPYVFSMRGRGPLAKDLEEIGVTVIDTGTVEDRADYLAFWKVARALRQHRIEILHTHNSLALFDGFAAARLSGVRAHVHTDHGRSFPDKRRYMIAEHATSFFLDQIVAVSEHTRDNLIRYEKISPKRVLTIPNGVAADLKKLNARGAQKRAELGISGGPVVGFIGRLSEQKGAIYLLRALAILRSQFPGITGVVAGPGELEDSLKRASVELGIQENVRFLGLRMDGPELLQAFDVFAIPSIWEGLPMALLEAMGWGCPVVATNVGGMGSVIQHGQNGSLVPPRDPEALAHELGVVLADGELRQRYRDAALRTFAEGFSAEAMTRRYEEVYLEALRRKGDERVRPAARSADKERDAHARVPLQLNPLESGE